jgi:hypothetical protein
MKKNTSILLFIVGIIIGSISYFFAHTYSNLQNITSIIPGWHTTIFNPTFWFLGMFTYLIWSQLTFLALRIIFKLEKYYPNQAMARLNLLIFVGILLIGCHYLWELVFSIKNGTFKEQMAFYQRIQTYFGLYALLFLLGLLPPFLFWRKKIRHNLQWTVFICLIINNMLIWEILVKFWVFCWS